MDFLNGKNGITIEPVASYGLITSPEGKISKVLSRWTALQMAVENEWGGCDSLAKSHQLASDIISCLFLSKEQIEVEELENLLHERLLLSFNTEIEDGSIEEVAEQLMIIRDEAFPSKSCFHSIK